MLIFEHVLEVAVGTDGGSEALAQQGEVKKSDQRDAGAYNAACGAYIEAEQPLKEIERRDEVRYKHKRYENRGRKKQDAEDNGGSELAETRTRIGHLLVDDANDPLLETIGCFAEDHLRAKVAAPESAVDHGHCGDEYPEEHQGKEYDGELADPQLRAEEVEALPRQIDAHDVEQGKSDKDDEADGLHCLPNTVELRAGDWNPRLPSALYLWLRRHVESNHICIMCIMWWCMMGPANAPLPIKTSPMINTVIADTVVPQRASLMVAAEDPRPTTIRAALVPSAKANMVSAPSTGDAEPTALISAA